jgi:hypothetical protein
MARYLQPRTVAATFFAGIACACLAEVGRRLMRIVMLSWSGRGGEIGPAAITFALKYSGSLAVAAGVSVAIVILLLKRRWRLAASLATCIIGLLYFADRTRIQTWSVSREEFISSFFNAFQKECRTFTVAAEVPSQMMVWLGLKAPPITRWSHGVPWVPAQLVFCDDDHDDLLEVAADIFPDATITRAGENHD